MSLTQDEVLEIMNLINESDYDELNLEMGDLKLTVKKSGGVNSIPGQPSTVPAPIEPPTAAPASQVVTQEALPNAPTSSTDSNSQPTSPEPAAIGTENDLIPIKSPLLGTFYTCPKPESPPFVKIGQHVTEDDAVCLVEVMKTYTTVRAGVRGVIAKICSEDAQMVEFGQILFLVKPEDSSEE